MLETKALSCSYGRAAKVLSDLTLSFSSGEMVAILGPNGSGKSSLLRCLSGLVGEMQISGEVSLKGRSLLGMSRREISQQLTLVCQTLELAFPLTTWEFVSMACYHRIDRLGLQESSQSEIVEQALRSTSTLDLADRSVHSLSGGEWQRVRIAQALAQKPAWLLLDEPTAHLDIRVQLELLDLLEQLNREQGLTVIFSLHDLGLALRHSKRAIVLSQGRLVCDGPTEQVLSKPELETIFGVGFERALGQDGTVRWVYPSRG
jgi:iron complex transport system ATP-binding protein